MIHKAPPHIHQALGLATQALFVSNPNPRVGCVLVSPSGEVIGQGFTQHAGGPHAEVMALRDASGKGFDTAGATAYVTLEPCSHHGRTGPCCDALIQAGVAKVVASLADPNPLVGGRGDGAGPAQTLRSTAMTTLRTFVFLLLGLAALAAPAAAH